MFTKSVLCAAVLALTNAEKRLLPGGKPTWNGLSPNDLVNVDVAALVQEELEDWLVRSTVQYEDYCNKYGKSHKSTAEKKGRHVEWLKTEGEIQKLNANSRRAKFDHNETSDWTQAARNARNGTKVPKEFRDVHRVNQTVFRRINIAFEIEMTEAEYQALYDNEYNKTNYSCQYFDAWFTEQDRNFLSGQRKTVYRQEVQKGDMSRSEFDDYWFRIEQDRATVRGAITRCFDDNNDGGDGDGGDDGTDPEPPTPSECDAASNQWIWGSDVVPPIKNQGSCGSCYAFSANFVLESALAIASGDPVKRYSEQQIVDCQNNYSNCYGCQGGWPVSLHISTRSYPIVLESVYPYTAREESCKSPSSASLAAATDVYWISANIDSLKRELCTGPIQVTLKAAGAFSWYSSGVLDSRDCPYNNDLDHAIGAIGWTVKDGVESLIVRNSWGTGWGEGGYAYFALDTGNSGAGPCGVYAYMSSASVNMNLY